MKVINKQTIRSIEEYANWAIDHIRYLKERAYKKYIKLAKDDNLPTDFDQWDLADKYGHTVAHVAAKHGNLPTDFNQWNLKNNHNWTVRDIKNMRDRSFTSEQQIVETDYIKRVERRVYNKYLRLIQVDKLPADFTQWDLADKHGWTIAHEAARHGYLPNDFNQWRLATNTGWSAAHEVAARNQSFNPEHRDLTDDHGWTVEFVASL